MDSVEQTLQILSNATGTNTELLNIKVSPGIGDIVVQLDVFNDQNEKPKTIRQSSTESINLNSHQEVFQSIMQQVTKTPNEGIFLIILQHLLRIDPTESLSNIMWKVVEKLVHRVTQLESSEEAERLVNSTITHKFSCQNCSAKVKNNENVVENKTEMKASSRSQSITCNPPTPPPPPPVPNLSSPMPPAAPPIPPQPPAAPGLPPPPPPLLQGKGPPLPPPNPLATPNNLLLPQQNAPRASRKLKTFNWAKIPQHKIMNKLNIWTIMANDRQYKCVELIDFKGIEGLFALQTTNKTNRGIDVVDGAPPRNKKEKEPKHIHLLDAQRSLKVNIFLSQFKGYNSEDIVQLILTGDCKIMNLERLKDLKKFFENEDEMLLLKNFVGDRQRLASAEKFLIAMLEVSNFKLRIESMILKEEFQMNVTYLEPCLNDIIQSGNNLMKSKTLQEILSIIIIIGNFLNSGGYAGNAAGIKLSSLTKLTEIKANKTGMHLLHLIAMEVKRYNPELLDLSHELKILESVSKINNDQIEKDIKDMDLALDSIKKEIYSPTTDEDLKHQMNEFIKKSQDKMEVIKKQISELKSLRITMADFFCEDLTTFKVDECFAIFHKFCEQFTQALKDNDKRQQLEFQASIRQKQKEEQLAQKALTGSTTQSKSPAHLPPKRVCLRSQRDSIEGNNTNLDINSKKNEDDLIAFLQNSNRKRCREKENNRKTRLDKRPDLLKFNFERERDQHSPNFVASSNENTATGCMAISQTQCLEEQKKTNLIQKSWKRLMEGYKASQLPENCLTPDISSKRERLQIFIRSNSTIENISGQPTKQAPIKIIKTPLPQTSGVFNFSLKEIASSQAEINSTVIKNFEAKNSKGLDAKSPLEMSDDKEITQGLDTTNCCEESKVEIKPSRIKFKTLASIVEIGCRYSSINEEDLKTTIKNLRTPTLEKPQFCFSPTTLKSNNWDWNQRQQVLNSVDEEKSNLELYENVKNNNKEQHQIENDCLKVVKPSEKEIVQEICLKTTEPEKPEEVKKEGNAKQEIREYSEAASVIYNEEEKTNDEIKTRENFSKRLVSKLQEKIRALSPSRPTQTTEQPNITSDNEDNEKSLLGSGNCSKINICSTNDTFDKNPTDESSVTVSKPSIEKEKPVSFKKSFVSRLQNRIRALSPLKLQPEQVANFQSYVNFENDAPNSKILKPKKDIQIENNLKKPEEGFKTQLKASVTKESIPREQFSSKDNISLLRSSRTNSRISICSTKTNNCSKELLGLTQVSKTPEKSLNEAISTSKTVLNRNCANSCTNKQTSLKFAKAKPSPKLTQDKIIPKKPHCQDLSASNSPKKYNPKLKNLASCQKIKPTKSLSSSTNSTTKFEAQRPSFQPNTNSSKSDQKRLSKISSKSLPTIRSSLPSKIVPAQNTIKLQSRKTIETSANKFTNSKLRPNSSDVSILTSTLSTKSTKSVDSRTNLKENYKKSSTPNKSLEKNYSTSTSSVKRSSLPSKFATRSSQSTGMITNNETFSGLSLPGKRLTFSEICQGKANSSLTSLGQKNLQNIAANSGATRFKPSTTSNTTEHNFKRPCRKFK